MNYATVRGEQQQKTGCGYEMVQNHIRYMWQSVLGLRDPPDIVELEHLARRIRNTWPTTKEEQK